MAKEVKGVKWKALEFEGSILDKDLDGLIGIEECINYNLSSISKKQVRKRKVDSKPSEATRKKTKTTKQLQKKRSTDSFVLSKNGSTSDVTVFNSDSGQSTATDNLMLAWNSFGLPNSILQAISELGFYKPTTIQELTLPSAILGRRDILGAAETGSGKTLAFGLPILTGILKTKQLHCDQVDSKPLYSLILTPTRELAVQIKNHLTAAAKYTGIQVAVILGGMAAVKQERILSKHPEIVVATPGRLWELIQEGNSHLSNIENIRFLAIDETDRMLEKGHFKELHDLLERLNLDASKCKERQNFVFSATLTLTHELPKHLAIKKKMKSMKGKKILEMTPKQKLQKVIDVLGITNPKVVDITQKTGTAESLSESRITCSIDEKDYYLYYFLQRHPGRTLIFCNSIGCVKRLTTLLGLLDCHALALHASMQQRQRLKNLERFRDNENAILIATDVASRGLDIPCVEHVLHYQTPRTSESYIHRSGRTARASREGLTVLLVEPSELKNYLKLCRNLGRSEDLPSFPVQADFFNAVKQRVNLARELDKVELSVRKTQSESGWLQKAAEEMDIIIDDNISMKFDSHDTQKHKKLAQLKRKQLSQLLAKPIFPKGFSGKFPITTDIQGNAVNIMSHTTENAIDVLKNSTNNTTRTVRKKAKWLFRSKVKK
ncbi:hypothetical protein PPYR_02531 [Photinus pyralis]|uniref:RNA helicase n=1 Tax=Photinus pyralis TaxID=7054 RepID=A0A1Y1KYD7_PHOPY|nr:ATP-dependent RNA helicase DDX24 [Photinus pyralis]KAB0805561.1 hypothetical protein PPYR_02531 [Photinus pyralis]